MTSEVARVDEAFGIFLAQYQPSLFGKLFLSKISVMCTLLKANAEKLLWSVLIACGVQSLVADIWLGFVLALHVFNLFWFSVVSKALSTCSKSLLFCFFLNWLLMENLIFSQLRLHESWWRCRRSFTRLFWLWHILIFPLQMEGMHVMERDVLTFLANLRRSLIP